MQKVKITYNICPKFQNNAGYKSVRGKRFLIKRVRTCL